MAGTRYLKKIKDNISYILSSALSIGAGLYGAYKTNNASHEATNLASNYNVTALQQGSAQLGDELYDFSRVQGIGGDAAVVALVFLAAMAMLTHRGANNLENWDLALGRLLMLLSVPMLAVVGKLDGEGNPQFAVAAALGDAALLGAGTLLIERNKFRTAQVPGYEAIDDEAKLGEQRQLTCCSRIIKRLNEHALTLTVAGVALGADLYGAFEANSASHTAKGFAANPNATDIQEGLKDLSAKLYRFSRIQGISITAAVYAFICLPLVNSGLMSLENWDKALGYVLRAASFGAIVQASRFDGQGDPQYAVATSLLAAGALQAGNMFVERHQRRTLNIVEIEDPLQSQGSAPRNAGIV